jgi:hypothetical protein
MNLARTLAMVALGLSVALSGCASMTSTTGAAGMMKGMNCPMGVSSAQVAVVDVGEGTAALAFSTSSVGDVVELRRQVKAMEEKHNRDHAEGGRMLGDQDRGGAMMKVEVPMPAATATFEEEPDGARLVLRPRDPATLDAVRKHLMMMAARLTGNGCPAREARADAS